MKLKNAFLKYVSMLFAVSVILVTTSCGDEAEPVTENIFEIASANPDLSLIMAEFTNAGLDGYLKAEGDYTFFAPSNTAITNLLGQLGLPDFSPIRSDIAQAVLLYHVTNQKLLFKDLVEGQSFVTLETESFEVVGGSALKTGGSANSSIDKANIKATNGIIHIIDAAMIPPSIGAEIVAKLGTVAQPVFLGKDFSTLANAIKKADTFASANELTSIEGLLANRTKQLTIFAPANAVFTTAGITLDTYTAMQWYGIITNHIVNETWTTFTAQQTKSSIAGHTLMVLTTSAPTNPAAGIYSGVAIDSNGSQSANGQIAVEGTAANGLAKSNGVVHALAGVLAPPAAL